MDGLPFSDCKCRTSIFTGTKREFLAYNLSLIVCYSQLIIIIFPKTGEFDAKLNDFTYPVCIQNNTLVSDLWSVIQMR